MNAVTDPSPNFTSENGGGSDSDTNSENDSPEYYQPISSVETNSDASDSDDLDTQFHPLPNGVSNGVSSLNLSDDENEDEETKRREEEERLREEAANEEIRRAMREDENRRRAPLTEDNANRVLEAMRGITFSGVTPVWAGSVPEEEWINRIRGLREPGINSRD